MLAGSNVVEIAATLATDQRYKEHWHCFPIAAGEIARTAAVKHALSGTRWNTEQILNKMFFIFFSSHSFVVLSYPRVLSCIVFIDKLD